MAFSLALGSFDRQESSVSTSQPFQIRTDRVTSLTNHKRVLTVLLDNCSGAHRVGIRIPKTAGPQFESVSIPGELSVTILRGGGNIASSLTVFTVTGYV